MIAPADCSLPGSWAYEAVQARSSSAAKLSEYDSLVRWEALRPALCSAQKAVTWSNNGKVGFEAFGYPFGSTRHAWILKLVADITETRKRCT
jgi:hypothetical protein